MSQVSNDRAHWLANHVLPHEPALRAWLARSKVKVLEIDDIVQETYATLAEMADVSHIQNPRTYAFSIAQSIVLQHVRRQRIVAIDAVAEIERLNIFSDEASPERRLADYQELRRMAQLIAGLPAKCREAFTLRKIEGLSQRDVARRMGVSENTIEKHMGKALRMLMKSLTQPEDDEERGSAPSGIARKSWRRGKDSHER